MSAKHNAINDNIQNPPIFREESNYFIKLIFFLLTKVSYVCIIPFVHWKCGCSSSGRAPPCQGGGSEFEPRHPLQKISFFGTRFFYPSRSGGISSAVRLYIIAAGVYHHRRCILLRTDDMQLLAKLMIYNSFGIDIDNII